ncbi:MAG: hypothetical protein GY810_26935 [Aureispira sp.]|nr:hypothetical protein [Aureispira sp.]
MKVLNLNRILFFLFIALVGIAQTSYAQTELEKEMAKEQKRKDKEAKKLAKQQAKANGTGGNSALASGVASLSREEKNTMKVCPLHNKHMPLSDNYRANASDFRQSEEYPFAYQLNYRRYCKTCTSTLEKEEKAFEKEEKRNANKGSFARCEVHNQTMKINGDHSSLNYERNPASDIPHAKQYLFKEYCKTCTKIYKINNDGAEVE